MLQLNHDILEKVNEIALKAGDEILKIYSQPFEIYDKEDKSPLTEADLNANRVILAELKKLTPDIPYVSEESKHVAWSERKTWSEYWLIDPLDGTKEFVKKNGEFTVNICLVQNNKPVMGIVYAPALDTLYFAAQKLGAFKTENATKPDSKKQAIQVAPAEENQKLKIVGSRSHPSPDLENYLKQFENYEIIPVGSSLKLCMLAEGKAHFYPRLGPTSEWDIGAAQAILEAAGGFVYQYPEMTPLQYNMKESLLNPYFIAQTQAN
jgi:3'(2'), 5'-bisphosphate nucleotidase